MLLIRLLAILSDQQLHTFVILATNMKQGILHVYASLMVHGMAYHQFVLVCQYLYSYVVVSNALSFVEIQCVVMESYYFKQCLSTIMKYNLIHEYMGNCCGRTTRKTNLFEKYIFRRFQCIFALRNFYDISTVYRRYGM